MGGDRGRHRGLCEDGHSREEVGGQPVWSRGTEWLPKIEVTMGQIPTQYQMAKRSVSHKEDGVIM